MCFPTIENHQNQADGLLRDYHALKAEAMSRIKQSHPSFSTSGTAEILRAELTLEDAQLVVAIEWGFLSWPRLVEAVEARGDRSGLVREAIERDNGARLNKLLNDHPTLVKAKFEWTDRKGRRRFITPFRYAHMRSSLGSMDILRKAGADSGFLGHMLWCNAYNLNLDQIERLLSLGVDPNRAGVLGAAIGSSWVFDVGRRHKCINTLIEAGAISEDGPVMDIHRGRLDALEGRIGGDPSLVAGFFNYKVVDETVTGLTLLHIAAAHNETKCAELLIQHGANINAKAQMLQDGSGGQTPLYHTIGTPRGACYNAFERLLAAGPDLTVRASMKNDGRIREFTPLGYALARSDFYPKQFPVPRLTTAREIERLRQLGAPE